MSILPEAYASPENAKKFVLRSQLAARAFAYLAQSEVPLTTTELAQKLGYQEIGTVNSLLRVFLVAKIVEKRSKVGNKQPYSISWPGLVLFSEAALRQVSEKTRGIDILLKNEEALPVFLAVIKRNLALLLSENLEATLSDVIYGSAANASFEILLQNDVDLSALPHFKRKKKQ
jgi:hypothetical protein